MYSAYLQILKEALHSGHIRKPGLDIRLVFSAEHYIRNHQLRVRTALLLLGHTLHGGLKIALVAGIHQRLLRLLCLLYTSSYVEPLAKAAVACGADGLMIEVHPLSLIHILTIMRLPLMKMGRMYSQLRMLS